MPGWFRQRVESFRLKKEGRAGRIVQSGLSLVVLLGGAYYYANRLNDEVPANTWLFFHLAKVWFYAALLTFALFSAGQWVLRSALRIRTTHWLTDAALGVPLGLVPFAFAMYAAGFVGWYQSWFALVLPLAFIALGAGSTRRLIGRMRAAPPRFGWLATLASAWAVLCLGTLYLQTMTPEAINFDAAWYHLPIAQDYAREGRIIPFSDYNSAFPHLTSLVHTWCYLVPGLDVELVWMLALHHEFIVFLWTLIGVSALCRYLLGGRTIAGAWTVMMLFPAVYVYDHNLGGGADHYLALFAAPLAIATGRLIRSFSARDSLLFALLHGAAVLTKYQALYFVVGSGVIVAIAWVWRMVIVLRARPRARRRRLGTLLRAPALVVAGSVLVTLPHFFKNYVFYNNPVYPFAQRVFTESRPAHASANYLYETVYQQLQYVPEGGPLERLLHGIEMVWLYSFEPHYSFTKGVPNQGSLFVLLLPCLFLIPRTKRVWIGVGMGVLGVITWGYTYNVDRYLQTLVPILAATSAVILVRLWERGWLARVGIVALVGLQVVWGADALFYSGHTRIDAAITLIRGTYEETPMEKRFAYRREYTGLGESLPEDARVLLHNNRSSLGIDRDLMHDIPGSQGLILYDSLDSPRALSEYYQSLGITHIVYTPNYRPFNSKQGDVLFTALMNRHAKDGEKFGHMRVVEVPKNVPEHEGPYRVLVMGIGRYTNGLYRITDLNVYGKAPPERKTYPNPLLRWPSDAEAAEELFGSADAAIIASWVKPGPILKTGLARFFRRAASYPQHAIYLRRQPAELDRDEPEDAPPRSVIGGDPEDAVAPE